MSRLRSLIGLALLGCVSSVTAAPGDLDPTFSGDGVVTSNVGLDQARGLAIDASGNVIAAGSVGTSTNGSFLVARYTDSGAPDVTFDTDGLAQDDFGANGDNAYSVLVDNSGRLVVVGAVNGVLNDSDVGIARFLANGTLDTSFDTDGNVTIDAGGIDAGFDVALDGANGILVAGAGNGNFLLARITDTGTLDAAFGTAGIVTGPAGVANAIAIDSTGRILVAGTSDTGANSDIIVARFSSAGVLDAAFGLGGVIAINLGAKDQAYGLAVDASDRVVVVGSRGLNAAAEFTILRLTSAGALDSSFNGSGELEVALSTGADVAYGVDLTSSGDLIVAGSAGGDTGVIKVLDNGTLDAAFGTGGVVVLDLIASAQDAAFDVVVDSQDRVLVAGRAFGGAVNSNDVVVARLEGAPTTADLAITKTNGVTDSTPGTNTVYTIIASNAGPAAVVGGNVSDTFPAACTSVTWSCTGAVGGTCTAAGTGNINDTVNLPSGASVTYTATCSIDPVATGTLDNTATVATDGVIIDPNLADNTATDSDTLSALTDMSITLTDAPDPVTAGTNLTYTATVTNGGPSVASGVTVTLPVPANTSFVSGTVSGGGSCSGAPVVCTITGTMAPASSRTATITMLVSPSTPNGSSINATATVASATTDTNGANNSAGTATLVSAQADLNLTLTASSLTALTNVPVTFTATSLNLGPSDAQNLSITVELTPDFRYGSHTASAGATCTVPQIGTTGLITCVWAGTTALNATRTLQVAAFSNNRGATAVNASTVSDTSDLVTANNQASVSVEVGLAVEEIPTVNAYGLVLLGLMLGLLGFVAVRRQV